MAGRPRKFSVEDVLDTAIAVFQEKGYEATSMTDLVKATGVQKGSLYQTFEDKHSFFIATLEHYLNTHYIRIKETFDNVEPSLTGFNQALHSSLDFVFDDGLTKGCLAINTINELGQTDIHAQAALKEHFGQVFHLVSHALQTLTEKKLLKPQIPIPSICHLLLVFYTGLVSNSKCLITQQEAHQLLDVQLTVLGLRQ